MNFKDVVVELLRRHANPHDPGAAYPPEVRLEAVLEFECYCPHNDFTCAQRALRADELLKQYLLHNGSN